MSPVGVVSTSDCVSEASEGRISDGLATEAGNVAVCNEADAETNFTLSEAMVDVSDSSRGGGSRARGVTALLSLVAARFDGQVERGDKV